MFERYAESARRVIFDSRYMANQARSSEIEPEHLLLGLLRADMGLAQRFLGSPWAAEDLWREIEPKVPARARTPGDLPLSTEAKRALMFAAEEADRLSSWKIGSEHLLLGLMRMEECPATAFLYAHGLQLTPLRDELARTPHDGSAVEKFVREAESLPQDVTESQSRLRATVDRMHQAIADHDFVTAHKCSDEEHVERDNLRLLYQKHGLSGWMFV